MINTKFRIRSAFVILTALLFAASVPAFADHGNSGASAGVSTANQAKTEAEAQSQTDTDSSHAELHSQGSQIVAGLEKTHKGKSAADVQKICTAHKQGLTTKFNAIDTNSQRIQDKIDGIFAEAQAYQKANNLSPANFDSLVTAATAAQTASNASIAALKDVTPTLDCNSTSVASDVATFKAAASKTRDSLKAYRTAVKAVPQALETAKPTTQGSN